MLKISRRNENVYMLKAVVLEKLPRMRQVLKLNELMDTSHQSKNQFKRQTLNGDKKKRKKEKKGREVRGSRLLEKIFK